MAIIDAGMFLALFFIAMWYGVGAAGLAYFFETTRGIPPLQFLLGAVLLPAGSSFAVMLLAIAGARTTSPGALLLLLPTPLALAFLFLRAHAERAGGEDYLRRRWGKAHAEIEEALAADPDNTLALMQKAKTLEEQRRYEEALAAYERTHAVSERMLPIYELEGHRRRLKMMTEKRDEDAARKARAMAWFRSAPVENVLLGFGLLLFLVAWPFGLQLTSYMLFVRWLHAEPQFS